MNGTARGRDLRRGRLADIPAPPSGPGRNAFLSQIWQGAGGSTGDPVSPPPTKADHLHHDQHPQLTAIAQALLRDARDRAAFSGARVEAMSIAALRTTTEDRNGA